MATSSRNNPRDSLSVHLGVLAAGLLGVAEAAPAPCANQEIVLEAKPLEMDYRNNNAVLRDVVITQCGVRIQAAEADIKGGLNFENSHWTISGDVRIDAEGGNLRSDKAVVTFRNKLISAATITGSPAQFEQQREDGTMARGSANTIEYETSDGTVSFNTNARLAYGRSEATGQHFVYNIRTQSLEPQKKSDAAGDGRIRFVIQPGKQPQITMPDKEKKKEKKP
ncbi:MAG TPA: lipopolysaccharide transport periplasmic protein LptA [Steroidobacteraceae bacterium]|nr:lipopolysaccharide transport periplasmic protein LptA [Steroidobacteraceae bacterium]